ncbi:MAG: porin [Alistipes sp.]
MKLISTALLFGLLCAHALPAAAQATAAKEPTLASLAAEIDSLKATTSTWDKIVAHLPHLSGYLQTGYTWSNTSSTFSVKRVRLSLSGDIASKLDYRVQLEFVSPKIVDAYLRYRPFTALNFKLGEYKLPFSIENTDYSPITAELIEMPLALQKLVGGDDLCGVKAAGRDLGATLYGGFIRRDDYCIINYDLGVFNGEGINTRDKNKSKDVVARLSLRPLRGLLLSGSYYWGEYGADYLRRTRYGVGACYDRGAVVVRGEYIGGTTDKLDSEGWYALAGWRVTRSLMPVVRYDTFRENIDLSSSRQTNYTAGLRWIPVKYLQCQLNYTYEEFASCAADDRHIVAVLLSGVF